MSTNCPLRGHHFVMLSSIFAGLCILYCTLSVLWCNFCTIALLFLYHGIFSMFLLFLEISIHRRSKLGGLHFERYWERLVAGIVVPYVECRGYRLERANKLLYVWLLRWNKTKGFHEKRNEPWRNEPWTAVRRIRTPGRSTSRVKSSDCGCLSTRGTVSGRRGDARPDAQRRSCALAERSQKDK
jgi:hypothetical protein